MAERRMIHKKISLSEQFNDMGEFAQLVFVLMIPHADDWGSLKGTARVIRGMAIPLNTTRTDKEVESALQEMEKQELVWRYRPDGEGPMLQLRRWEDHQTGLGNRTKPKRKLYFYCEDARKLLETAGIDWDYEEFHKTSENLSELQKDSPVTKQNITKQKETKVAKKPRKRGNPESRKKLKHWAFEIWRDVFGKKVKGKPPDIEQRDAIIAFAESKGEEWWRKRLEYWKQHPWSPWNFKGMMETKWEPTDAKDRRRDKQGQDTDSLPYDDFAAAQAARLHAAEAGDGGPGAE